MRKLLTIPLWFIGFLIVVVIGVYVWLTQSSWLRNQIEGQVNNLLGATTDLSLAVGDMSGDLFSGVTLSDISVVLIRGDVSDTLATVDRMLVRYNARNLFSQNRSVRAIEIFGPRITVPRDSIESVFRKVEQQISEKVEVKGSLELALDSILIHDGAVFRRGDTLASADSVAILASFRSSQGLWQLNVAPSSARTIWVGPVQFEGAIVSMGNTWHCDSLSVRTPKSSFVVSGGLNSLQIRNAQIDFEELTQTTDIKLQGAVTLSGDVTPNKELSNYGGHLNVSGRFKRYELDGLRFRFVVDSAGMTFDSLTGAVSDARFHGRGGIQWKVKPERWEYAGTVGGFDLSKFAQGVLSTDLSGYVEVQGTGLTNDDLRVRVEADLDAGRVDEFRFESASGSLGATVDSLWIGEDFAVGYNGASLVGGGTVAFADSIDLFVSFNSPDLRRFDRMVFIDSLAGRVDGYAYLSGLTKDPDIAAFINSDSLRLFDLRTAEFDARVFVPHFLSNPSGQIDARWGSASTWGLPTDSISMHATLSGRTIDIGWARWCSPVVDIEGSGTLDWSADTIPLNLYPLTLRWENQTYSAANDVILTIDSAGFNFHQFEFEGPLGIFLASGRMGFDNSMALDFEVDRFRIEKVSRRFFPGWDIDGVISARGQLNGTFESPVIDMAGDVSELEFEGESYGTLEGNISYRDRVLYVESAELDNRYFHASASGTFPIDLTFDSVSTRALSDRPLTGRLEASGDNLDPINRFLPQTIESVRGNFTLKAGVTGTPQKPLFSGEASLTNGTIKTIEIINPLEDVTIDVALRHDTVVVRRASAVVRDKNRSGTVDAKGSLRIASIKTFDYDLQLIGRGVPARMEFKDFYVLADFDLSVIGLTPPKVVGQVRPQRVEDREPFSETEARPVYDPSLWDWDIAIDLPSGGYFIKNDQLDAELSANLRLLRDRGQPSYLGGAEFIRGRVYLFDKTGRVERGVLTFDDPIKNDPLLDLDVVFRIQQKRVQTGTETSPDPIVDLDLHISGRASEPLIQPEAPYSEQDVLLLLATNMTISSSSDTVAVSDPLANRLRFAATGLVFSEVQRAAARKLGLETLEINSGENPFDASITVGRYVVPQLYLYGTTPIDAGSGQEVGFEYRISRRVFLDGNRNKDNLYRMNLHFNWEY